MRQRSAVLHRRKALGAQAFAMLSELEIQPRTKCCGFLLTQTYRNTSSYAETLYVGEVPCLHFQPTASRACRHNTFGGLKLTAQTNSDIQRLPSGTALIDPADPKLTASRTPVAASYKP